MKKGLVHLLLGCCLILNSNYGFAQKPVQVGKGSYAEYTPIGYYLDKINGGDNYQQNYDHIYVENAEQRSPLPTNDWWSQMMVDVVNKDGFVGHLWAYPHTVGGDGYGSYIEFPKHWNDEGTTLKSDTRLNIWSDGFMATNYFVRDWSDWGVSFVLTDEKTKTIEVALSNGCPFTYYKFTNTNPVLNFPNTSTFFRKDGSVRNF